VVSSGTPVSSTSKNDRRDITEILLKVALNSINQPSYIIFDQLIIKIIAIRKMEQNKYENIY
jgi:hypothetical protein